MNFAQRHIGPPEDDQAQMLKAVGYASLDELTSAALPAGLAADRELSLPEPVSEEQARAELRRLAGRNRVLRSMIGLGYYGTFTPAVIRRNVLEAPAWYTAYTPYQPEISQGRLEALLNFQTMVADLVGLPVSGASLLDEATAAAEARGLSLRSTGGPAQRFGVPMGFGGPHAGYMAVRDGLARSLPGRLVGVSQDAHGNRALRLALQ